MTTYLHDRLRRLARVTTLAALALGAGTAAFADDRPLPRTGFDLSLKDGQVRSGPRADGHAPIGVMPDHRHHKGELMLSFRYMRMGMDGNLIGDDNVSPETIVTTVPNRFFGRPGQPPTLRIVPTEMSMDMYMFGAMYGISDRVTLMGMVPYIEKEMDHVTFAGPAGTVRRGTFTTKSEGIGDISATAIIGLYDSKSSDSARHFNVFAGLSAPTGSTKERDTILTPMGTRPTVRMPYPMQLGSGTWDFMPGAVYTSRNGDFSWGAQYKATLRLEDENDQGYALGDVHQGTAWVQYQWKPWISSALRIAARTQDDIDGIDLNIVGPVQTANPDFHGGERVDLLFGVNTVSQRGAWCGHRLAAEFGVPIYQHLNGPQMETDYIFTIGWQKTLHDC